MKKYLLLVSAVLLGCSANDPAVNPPSIVTAAPTQITLTSATLGGTIVTDHPDLITGRGVCWAQHQNPELDKLSSKPQDGAGAGTFVSELKGLGLSKYYVRAYAKVGAQVFYGNEVVLDIGALGKILVAGYADDGYGGHHTMIVVRLKGNGSLDNSFASSGKFTFAPVNKRSECRQLALQPDGKIIVAGHIDTFVLSSFFRYDFCALRLNTNGTLDNSFGIGGVARADKGTTDIANAVALLSDGRIILGGSTNFFGSSGFAALGLNPNGSIDNSFGTAGWNFTDVYGSSAGCAAMVAEPDDDIIMGGLDTFLQAYPTRLLL